MKDMDEMRKGLLEIQAEGRQNQGRLEASMASLNDLIKQRENMADTRMAEMSAVLKERDRQADERKRLMSDLMQRRETDANTRMKHLKTTMKDLTLGVRAMAAATSKKHLPKFNKTAIVVRAESCVVCTDPLTSASFDPSAHGASTTGDY